MSEKVWYKDVFVIRLHGFALNTRQLSLHGLQPGLNVVYGGNGSGKSTLSTALKSLLKGGLGMGEQVEGTISTPTGDRLITSDKSTKPISGYPEAEKGSVYSLDINELLSGLAEADVQQISSSISQGYRPSKLKSSEIKASKASEELKRAIELLRAAEQKSRDLWEKQDERDRLTLEIESRKYVEGYASSLKRYQELVEKKKTRESLIAQRDKILTEHPGIEKQGAGFSNTVKSHWSIIRNEESNVEGILKRCLKDQPNGEKPIRPLSTQEKKMLEQIQADLAGIGQQLKALSRDRARLMAALEDAKQRLTSLHAGGLLDEFDLNDDKYSALADLPSRADKQREQIAQAEGLKKVKADLESRFGLTGEGLRADEMDDLIEKIRDYLKAEPEPATPDKRPWILLLVGAIGSIVVVGATALNLTVGIILLVLLIIAEVYVFQYKPLAGYPSQAKAIPSDLANQLNGESPIQALAKLQGKKAQLELSRVVETISQSTFTTEDYSKVLVDLGLDPKLNPYELSLIYDKFKAINQSHRDLAKIRGEETELSRQSATAVEQVTDILNSYGYQVPSEVTQDAAPAIIASFIAWEENSDELESAKTKLEKLKSDLTSMLDNAGIPAAASLEDRLRIADERQTVADQLEVIKHELNLAKETPPEVAEFSNLEAKLADWFAQRDFDLSNPEDREAARQKLEDEQSQTTDLKTALDRLIGKIEDQERERIFENAQLAYAKQRESYIADFDAAVANSAQAIVTNELLKQLRTKELPPVIESANRWISRFTSGRFEVEVPEETPRDHKTVGPVLVTDTLFNKTQPYKELSTGTRVHVALGLRLGLIETLEEKQPSKLRYPLIVDEALAVSDDRNSQEIVGHFVKIAEERQVIFFTNNQQDLALLKREAPNVEVRILTEVPKVDGLEMQNDLPPQVGISPFQITRGIGHHAVKAILPSGTHLPNPDLTMWSYSSVLTEQLESVRKRLLDRYPRVTIETVNVTDWAGGKFMPDIEKMVIDCRGDGKSFYDALGSFTSFRKRGDAQEWLREGGYLLVPNAQDVEKIVREECSNGQSEDDIRHYTNLFYQAYIPVLEERLGEPVSPAAKPKRARSASSEAIESLFEED